MKIKLFVRMLCFFSIGCTNERPIYYITDHASITRIDYNGASDFYYGHLNREDMKLVSEPCIRAEYYGLNNGMDMFLVFKKNSDVELVNYGVDYLEKKGNCKMEIGDYENSILDNVLADYRKKGFAIFRISNSIPLERKFPQNKGSAVVAEY